MTILSILAEKPRHPDLQGLERIGDALLIDTPLDSLGRADLLVACQDGAMLGIVYYDLVGFFNALRQQELTPRLVATKQRWPWAYLVLGFIPAVNADGKVRNARGEPSGWTWEAISGAMLQAQEMGVSVLHIPHVDQLPALIERLAKRDRGPVRASPLRDSLWYSEAVQLLMAIPGIGETKADDLIEQCGSAAAALQALTDDSLRFPGVGPETRKKARAVLGLRDSEALGAYPTLAQKQAA